MTHDLTRGAAYDTIRDMETTTTREGVMFTIESYRSGSGPKDKAGLIGPPGLEYVEKIA